jgi:hypothetical protein
MNKEKLRQLRNSALKEKRILCTGNPDHVHTIAHGIKQVFPTADFASRSTGYDLTFTSAGSEEYFKSQLKNYNVLLNCSFLNNGAQIKILNIANEIWKHGHVINIGSTSENHIDTYPNRAYAEHKLQLRNRSLELHNYRFRTTHVVLGGIHTDRPESENWLDVVQIARAINWIIDADFDVTIIGIEPEKDPW